MPSRVCRKAIPLPAARLTAPLDGMRASNTSATRRASDTSPSSRCNTRLSRNGFRNRTPASKMTRAIRLKMIILRASGDRFSEKKPFRLRAERKPRSATASGEIQSSPKSTSPVFLRRTSSMAIRGAAVIIHQIAKPAAILSSHSSL